MEYTEEVFLSPRYLPNYKQIVGDEASEILKDMGYRFVHVDIDGNIHAMSKDNQRIEGYKVYKRRVPKF